MRIRFLAIIIALLALPAATTAQRNPGAKGMAEEFGRFVAAKDLKLQHEHPGTGLFVHYFKYTFNERETGDSTFIPPVLQRLVKAFERNRKYSEATFFHNPGAWQSPIRVMRLSWPDTYWDRIHFNFPLLEGRSYRFATFSESDSLHSCYALVWHPVAFTDKDGKPFRCIDGYIFELRGRHWYMDPAGEDIPANDMSTHIMQDMYTTQQETLAYTTLKEQVARLGRIYEESNGKKDEAGMEAVAYTLYDIGQKYQNSYTQLQFDAIDRQLAAMLAITPEGSGRQMLITGARKTLAAKTVTNSRRRVVLGNNLKFMQKDFEEKSTIETYTIGDTTLEQVVDWEISGRARSGEKELTVTYMSLPRSSRVLKPEADGRFRWTCRLSRNRFVQIGDGETGWLLIADGEPLSIDMATGEMRGSEVNRRLIEYQKRIKRLLPEARKYTTNVDNYKQIIDIRGFNAIIDSMREIQIETMRENTDNLIPALILSREYTTMTYEQLSPLMQRERPYASHVMMQPVWNYFEGLKKRLPGTIYTDVELQDTTGTEHRLSEYVGRGYVLLHFWSTTGISGRKDIPILKKINRMRGKTPLRIIGISLNTDRDDWARYVKQRRMNWTHLSDLHKWDSPAALAYGLTTMPCTVIIGPDGRIVAEGLRGEALIEKVKELTGCE